MFSMFGGKKEEKMEQLKTEIVKSEKSVKEKKESALSEKEKIVKYITKRWADAKQDDESKKIEIMKKLLEI